MHNIIAGFIGPQEIIIIILLGIIPFIILPIYIVVRLLRSSRNKNNNAKWTGQEVEKQFKKYHETDLEKKDIREYYPVKEGNKISLIQFNEIVDFSTSNNYVFLKDASGKDYLVDSNLTELENKLPKEFIRVHKSTIVNSKLIQEIKKLENGRYDLVMKSDTERVIQCSKNYNEKIKKLINF